MFSRAVNEIVDRIANASRYGPPPPELYAELRTALMYEADNHLDPTISASLRLIADLLPIFRQWMDIEYQRGSQAIVILDAACNAIATLSFNVLDVVSSKGSLVSNSQMFLGRVANNVINTATLQDMELHRDQKPS